MRPLLDREPIDPTDIQIGGKVERRFSRDTP